MRKGKRNISSVFVCKAVEPISVVNPLDPYRVLVDSLHEINHFSLSVGFSKDLVMIAGSSLESRTKWQNSFLQ